MFIRFISAALAAAVLCVGGVTAALADAYQVSLGEAVILMDFPASWKVKKIDRGLQAVTPDEEVYIWVEACAPKQCDTVFDEHKDYFDKQKVTLKDPTSVEGAMNGMKMIALDFPATYKGKKTIVRYLVLNPGLKNGAKVIVSTWSSVEGDKKHDKASNAFAESLKLKK